MLAPDGTADTRHMPPPAPEWTKLTAALPGWPEMTPAIGMPPMELLREGPTPLPPTTSGGGGMPTMDPVVVMRPVTSRSPLGPPGAAAVP